MRHVTIIRTGYDFDRDQVVREETASFYVGPEGVTHVEFGVVPDTVPVLDPETGERVTLQNAAERWADLLPGAYRSGDLVVSTLVVEHDGHEHPLPRPKRVVRADEAPVGDLMLALTDLAS